MLPRSSCSPTRPALHPLHKQSECKLELQYRGLDNAGKTTIVKRINGDDISTISPTLGFNIKTMQYKRQARSSLHNFTDQFSSTLLSTTHCSAAKLSLPCWCCSFRLNIWDVGGQKSLRSYWRNYFEQTDAMVWVIDSADVHRMLDCRTELHNLLKEEKLAGATLLIFANKQDVGGALQAAQIEQVPSAFAGTIYFWTLGTNSS